jgi:hypothetical protein
MGGSRGGGCPPQVMKELRVPELDFAVGVAAALEHREHEPRRCSIRGWPSTASAVPSLSYVTVAMLPPIQAVAPHP